MGLGTAQWPRALRSLQTCCVARSQLWFLHLKTRVSTQGLCDRWQPRCPVLVLTGLKASLHQVPQGSPVLVAFLSQE